jgi:hypothetical protein
MNELEKWIEATIGMVRAGLSGGATPEARAHGAMACLSLHAILSPRQPVPTPPAPVEPDVFDVLMAKLEPWTPKTEPTFNPRLIPNPSGK